MQRTKKTLYIFTLVFSVLVVVFYQKVYGISKDEEIIKAENVQRDDYLLMIVDKNHCLLESYVPVDLVEISEYAAVSGQELLLKKSAIDGLQNMVVEGNKAGIELKVVSAYRSYQNQEKTCSSWAARVGADEALRYSALPGCSQHQLGTVVDFDATGVSFANTPAGIWLKNNSWRYGWVLSYPAGAEDITGFAYEPWHYRYIGEANAIQMHESGLILSKYLEIKNN